MQKSMPTRFKLLTTITLLILSRASVAETYSCSQLFSVGSEVSTRKFIRTLPDEEKMSKEEFTIEHRATSPEESPKTFLIEKNQSIILQESNSRIILIQIPKLQQFIHKTTIYMISKVHGNYIRHDISDTFTDRFDGSCVTL